MRDLLRAGRITLEDALKKVPDKEAFQKLLEEVQGRRDPAAADPVGGPNTASRFNSGMVFGIRR